MRIRRPTTEEKINCHRGAMSIDFLFSIVVVFGVIAFLLKVAFSFCLVEITQYIAFATARAHAAGDLTMAQQVQAGLLKYRELVNNPVIAGYYQSGAFKIPKSGDPSIIKSGPDGHFDEYLFNGIDTGDSSRGIPFVGVKLPVKISFLKASIPFLGKVHNEDDFSTNITGFMIREPSQDECLQFFQKRYSQGLLKLPATDFRTPSRFQQAYAVTEDNGC